MCTAENSSRSGCSRTAASMRPGPSGTCPPLLLGLRVDYYQPDVQPYADLLDPPMAPLAVTTPGAKQWQFAPYITWHQSPWVHWRLEWDHLINTNLGPDQDTLWLQCVWAAGPHKHERY